MSLETLRELKIILAAKDIDLFDAWTKYCGDLPNVSIHFGSILDLEVDAIVSPANSFGFMDGGLDLFYTLHFGPGVQKRLQDKIKKDYDGELLVGQATAVATHDEKIPFVISAPTMRVPLVLPIDTVNPYLAAKAVFNYIKNSEIKSVSCPGLATGIGRVSPNMCARQMRTAIQDTILNPRFPATWKQSAEEHKSLIGLK